MQIWGGEGYMRDNGVERIFRDARVNRIVEGATEVMTAFIALVGMKGVGEALQGVVDAVRHPVEKFDRLTDFAKHEWNDILMGHGFEGLSRELAPEGQMLVKMTRMLARDVEHACRKFREDILEMQLVQQRIALSAVDLYAMACVISRLQATIGGGDLDGAQRKRDLAIGKLFCRSAADRIQGRLENLLPTTDRDVLSVADMFLG
jgi:alkylation response protein AidB-like acyl-CoA dehydrogenase